MTNQNYKSKVMKKKVKIFFMMLSMIMLFSCDYETHVINTVHEDGSVTRKVTMKNSEDEFEPSKYRVPVDSTWQIEIASDVDTEGDTSWILTAEKHFANVEAINEEYETDKGSNKALQRAADFSRKFKWFTTVFRYTESIEKSLTITCPVSDFLSDEELKFFYLPDNVSSDLKNGSDSLKYEALSDTIDTKSEVWMWTSLVRQWIEVFYDRFEGHPDLAIGKDEMASKESVFVNELIEFERSQKEEDEEALNGIEEEEEIELDATEGDADDIELIVTSVLGKDFYLTFQTEIDSSMSVLESMTDPFFSAEKYEMEIRMPGRIIASSGYADTDPENGGSGGILWTVKEDYFLTEQYVMWAESRINNYWTWIVTALFILFVITGFVVRTKKVKS
jgi:hypothetical protein